jgi:hypothetical protein
MKIMKIKKTDLIYILIPGGEQENVSFDYYKDGKWVLDVENKKAFDKKQRNLRIVKYFLWTGIAMIIPVKTLLQFLF